MRTKIAVAFAVVLVSLCAAASGQQTLPTRHTRKSIRDGSAAYVSHMQSQQQMNFGILLPLSNQAAATSFIQSLYDPASPNYRKFLTVAQFTDQFGPTDADYQAVVSFAQSNGLTVTNRHPNRLLVEVSGTVQQIESAFNIHMNIYQHPTEKRTFFSPDSEPIVNGNIPPWHLSGLDSYSVPRPISPNPSPNPSPITPRSSPIGSGLDGSYLPKDMRAAYYAQPGQDPLTGQGQSVGIVEYSNFLGSPNGQNLINALTNLMPVPTPTISTYFFPCSIMSGVLTFSGSITLADSNPLTAIYYTTDGSTPTLPLGSTNTTSLYTGPVSYGGITGNIPNQPLL